MLILGTLLCTPFAFPRNSFGSESVTRNFTPNTGLNLNRVDLHGAPFCLNGVETKGGSVQIDQYIALRLTLQIQTQTNFEQKQKDYIGVI